MSEKVVEYEIKSYTRFSWGYVYTKDGRSHEIWAENEKDLKRKALAKNLPWDDSKVPKPKSTNMTATYIGLKEPESSPASFRLPWCKSNYKRY